MNSINSFLFKIKREHKKNQVKKLFCLSLIFILIINFFYIFNNFSQLSNNLTQNPISDKKNDIQTPNLSADPTLFQDPFTINFDKIWEFFDTNYLSDLGLDVDTYFRNGDNVGIITDDIVYPVDNLYLYNTFLKGETSATEIFNIYLDLKDSILWYNSSTGQYNYGFVGSVDTSTGSVFDSKRYLIDNLMPIFLLIENIGDEIATPINGIYPQDSIEEIFNLINSDQFYDIYNKGFSHYNTSDFSEEKFTESNLYAILATLQIRHLYEDLGLNSTVKDRAYELANLTMEVLLDKMWDNDVTGFDYKADNTWNNTLVTGGPYKCLSVNALGIITLLEYWLETGKNNASLFDNAISLYNKINQSLWTTNGFKNYSDPTWDNLGDARIDIDSNSLMMKACLRLFELTGNYTYYNQAIFIHKVFERDFYDGAVNAYDASFTDDSKNFAANMKLIDSYLKAFEIYSSSYLNSNYNVTEDVPNIIFNQETLNISSTYSIQKNNTYYNTSTNSYEDLKLNYSIISADITYIFKYPNGTIFYTQVKQIVDNNTILTYNINDSLPIGDNYKLYIYANTTYFKTAQSLKFFNVTSGLEVNPIIGLPSTVYQGPIYNITLPINNTRDSNVTLTVVMEGDDIINDIQIIEFDNLVLTNVSFNLTTELDPEVGLHSLNFTFKDGDILYLEIIKQIEIGYSFDYSNFFYKNRIVSGDKLPITMNIINFLPNSTQSLNISFTGDYIQDLQEELVLSESEIRTLNYKLNVSENIIDEDIEIEMKISKETTTYYSKTFHVEILPKFEIISASFPLIISQGQGAYFIMFIRNNQEFTESFSIYVNGVQKAANINGLAPGENRIELKVTPTINPYDFQSKTYTFELKDSSGETIVLKYFEVSIKLSTFNLIMFYIVPIIIPIGIVLFYKNKELKHRLLRR
ncbi:MAG: hypothetical protein ACFFD5_11175 [Candidatus Thorarchaeota archaeon]